VSQLRKSERTSDQLSRDLRKEKRIQEGLTSLHEFIGAKLATVIFAGFSGQWDETLVTYLVGRAAASERLYSLRRAPTMSIARVARDMSCKYTWMQYESGVAEEDATQEFDVLLDALTRTPAPLLDQDSRRMSVGSIR